MYESGSKTDRKSKINIRLIGKWKDKCEILNSELEHQDEEKEMLSDM